MSAPGWILTAWTVAMLYGIGQAVYEEWQYRRYRR